MLNYENYSQVTNVLAADFNNLTNIIPDLDNGFDGLKFNISELCHHPSENR